ncbi:MAG: chemotaxis protein CheW [Alkalispirochaeta sp.]
MNSETNTEMQETTYEEEDMTRDRYLCFTLEDQSFAVPITVVREIVEMQEITPVPHMPEYLRGVVNLRGQIIPIIDLRLRLGMDYREYDRRTCIVIVAYEGKQIGLVVDRMDEVVHFDENHREPAPDYRDDHGMHQFIGGVGRRDDQVVMLLETDTILARSQVTVGSDG